MEIAVCLKQSTDPGSVEINPRTGQVEKARVIKMIDPSGLCALEAALQIKEQFGGRVALFSIGPAEADKCLTEALAMGADQVLRIWEYDWENVSSSQLTAYALSFYLKKQPFDLILCGDSGDRFHAAEVPAWIAEYLALPLLTGVAALTVQEEGKSIRVKRKLEKGKRQVLDCRLPAVLAVTESIHHPRKCALPDLLTALEQEIPVSDLLLKTVARMIPGHVHRDIRYQVQQLRRLPHLIYAPDCSLSGAERIAALVSGGVERKKTEFVQGSPQEAARRIIAFLEEKEVIARETGREKTAEAEDADEQSVL